MHRHPWSQKAIESLARQSGDSSLLQNVLNQIPRTTKGHIAQLLECPQRWTNTSDSYLVAVQTSFMAGKTHKTKFACHLNFTRIQMTSFNHKPRTENSKVMPRLCKDAQAKQIQDWGISVTIMMTTVAELLNVSTSHANSCKFHLQASSLHGLKKNEWHETCSNAEKCCKDLQSKNWLCSHSCHRDCESVQLIYEKVMWKQRLLLRYTFSPRCNWWDMSASTGFTWKESWVPSLPWGRPSSWPLPCLPRRGQLVHQMAQKQQSKVQRSASCQALKAANEIHKYWPSQRYFTIWLLPL